MAVFNNTCKKDIRPLFLMVRLSSYVSHEINGNGHLPIIQGCGQGYHS